MKTPFLHYWDKRRERGETLEKRKRIRLTTAQVSTLLGDSDVRAALQKSRVASLLPPVGTEVFRRFTPTTLEQINKCSASNNKQAEDYGLKPAPELESEKTLPFFYGIPPPVLRNVPLEDPDPFYRSQKTFVVVDRLNTLSRFNAESSCFIFSPFSLFRRGAIKILNHWLFTMFLCATLLVNFFFLVPREPVDHILEWVFLSVYTLEAVLKVLSRGFCVGRFTYLRDSWNRLDLVIIITGFASLCFKDLMFFKALRFLKVLPLFPGLRRNARVLGRVLNRLWDVLVLTVLLLSVFAILGKDLFSGSLRNKCVLWPEELSNRSDWSYTIDENITKEPAFNYKAYINDASHHSFNDRGEVRICGNGSTAGACPDGYMCLRTGSTPNYGFTNFDHFGYSFLAALRLMCRDFWENLAHLVMRTEGTYTMIYFVVALFLCSFSLIAFILAAFIISFTEQTEREVKEAEQDQTDYNKILVVLKDKVEDELPEKTDPKVPCCQRFCSCDCSDCWVRIKKGLQVVVLDPFFDLAIIILIILNVCLFSTEHYPMTVEFEETLSVADLVFSFIFLLEVVLKIVALGPYEFFKVTWHCFDTFLVVVSLLDLGLADVELLTLFHGYRILRLFRLGRWWPGLLRWMRLVWAGLWSFWALSVVLVTLFFSVLGMFIFSETYQGNVCQISVDCELPRWHWNSYMHSLMMVTRALGGEWIETMWDCLAISNGFMCVVFYITLLIVGNFLIFTVFFTLLMKWISDKLAPKDEEKLQASKTRISKMLKACGINAERKTKKAAVEDTDGVALSCVTSEQTEENGTQSSTLPIGEAQKFQMMKKSEDATEEPEDCCCQKCYSCCPSLNLDKSQGCGRVWANLRRASFNILQHPYFNNFIFLIVLVSSISLVCEDMYLPTRPALQVALGYLDQVITYLFVLEVLFKWIALGFHRYFRDGWCWLEFVVTLACVLSVAAQTRSSNLFLISLKALRPLRILAHIKGTKKSVCSLLTFVPSLVDVILVCLTVWLLYASVFVSIYAGKFFYCINETSNEIFDKNEVHNKTECMALIEANFTEVRWRNTHFNFDSVANGYLSLLCMGTLKGWIDLLYSASDSTLIEDQPVYENSLLSYLLFLCFFLFGCFFCVIHILKTLMNTYSAQTRKMGGTHLFLTEKQMKNFSNISFSTKRPLAPCPRPKGRLRGRLFDLVSRECFEWVMQGVILVSVVLLMYDRYDMSDGEYEACYWIAFVIIVIFLLEFILKICAFGRSYFKDNLNIVDFVVLIVQIVGIFISELIYYYISSATSAVLVLLRLGRLRRLLHRFPWVLRLRLLFTAWTKSLVAVFHLALILFVLMFAYASFGTFHFSQLQENGMLTDQMNFETVSGGLLGMWAVVTWGGWEGLLLPTLLTPPDCVPAGAPWAEDGRGTCSSPALGMTFFVSFLCLSSLLVLVALLVVLVDMLSVFAELRYDPLSVVNLGLFFKTWKKFVPDSSHFIQRSQLPDLCDKLKEPLKIPKPTELDLELSPQEQVHCRDVLLALSMKALGDRADKDELKAKIDEKLHKYLPNNPSKESHDVTLDMTQEEAASPVIEEAEE